MLRSNLGTSAVAARVAVLVAILLVVSGCQIGTEPESDYGPVTYVAVGASDSVGVGAANPERHTWVAIINRRLPEGGMFFNLGVSGTTAEQALAEQIPKAVRMDPDLVTVWLAVNDLNQFIAPDTYSQTLREILRRLRANGARVFVGNLPDLSKVPAYSSVPKILIDRRVSEYNKEIRTTAKQTGSILVDLHGVYEEASHKNGSLISSDGFHPSEAGYEVIAEAFWMSIKNDSKIGPRVSQN